MPAISDSMTAKQTAAQKFDDGTPRSIKVPFEVKGKRKKSKKQKTKNKSTDFDSQMDEVEQLMQNA